MKPLNLLHRAQLFLCATLVVALMGCVKEPTDPDPTPTPPTPEPSGIARIDEITLKRQNGANFVPGEVTVEWGADTIKVTVPAFTDLTKLIVNGSYVGVTISPAFSPTATIDFSSPVTYTVTAENGNKKSYVVVMKKDIIKNLLFVGLGDSFGAMNARTGEFIWKYFSTGGFAYSSPTISNGMVYAGGVDSKMYAFDLLTGEIKWSYETGPTGIECPPTVANGTVYFGSNDDYFYALDAATGAFKWRYRTNANVSSRPAVDNGTVYFGSSDNNVYALDAGTGTFKWKFTTGGMINQSGVVYSNGAIFFGSRDAHLYAVDAVTGAEKWRYSSEGISFEQSTPQVVNGTVYIASWYNISGFNIKGSVHAVEEATGKQVWKVLDNGYSANPFVANGILYISADGGNFYALDAATGQTKWMHNILPNGAGAVAADGVVYVGGGGTHYYYAFDAVTGTEKWKVPLNNSLMTSDPCMFDSKGNVVSSR